MTLSVVLILLTVYIVVFLLNSSNAKIYSTHSFIPFVFSYFLFSYIGIPLLFLETNSYVQEKSINDSELIIHLILISSVSIILVTFFYVVIQSWLFKGLEFKFSFSDKKVVNRLLIGILLTISMVSIYVYISQLDTFALLLSFYDEDKSIALSRSDATNNFPHVWRYVFFAGELLPFISYLLLAENILYKNKKFSFLFIVSFLLFSFYSLINLQKSTLPFYLFSLVFCFKLASNKSFNLRELFAFSLIGIILVSAILYLATGSEINVIFSNVFVRILSGTPAASYFYLKIFPYEHDFLYGTSLPNPGSIFPFEVFELTKFVSSYFNNLKTSVVGSAPGPFWSDIYANFGFIGVFLFCPLIGLIFNIVDLFKRILRPSPLNIALFTYITFEFREFSTTGFLPIFGAINILLIYLVYLLLKFSKNETNFNT